MCCEGGDLGSTSAEVVLDRRHSVGNWELVRTEMKIRGCDLGSFKKYPASHMHFAFCLNSKCWPFASAFKLTKVPALVIEGIQKAG